MNEKPTKEQILGIIAKYGKAKEQLLAILLDIQEASGSNCVTEEWAQLVAKELDLPLSKVFDVLTFYAMFSTKPRGRYVIEICNSAPCYYSNSEKVAEIFQEMLGIKMGETTPDGLFTLLYTSCIGACDQGPVAKIGDKVYGFLNKDKITGIINEYREVVSCQK